MEVQWRRAVTVIPPFDSPPTAALRRTALRFKGFHAEFPLNHLREQRVHITLVFILLEETMTSAYDFNSSKQTHVSIPEVIFFSVL